MKDEDLKLFPGVVIETPRGRFRASTLPLARLKELGWGVHFVYTAPSGIVWYIVNKDNCGIACTEKRGDYFIEAPVFVVRIRNGEKRGDYSDVPDGMTRAEYVDELKGLDDVVGVYDCCCNCGPIRPFWER